MLWVAFNWRNEAVSEQYRPDPTAAAKHVDGFGRDGDAGVVAAVAGQDVGAAWYRLHAGGASGLHVLAAQAGTRLAPRQHGSVARLHRVDGRARHRDVPGARRLGRLDHAASGIEWRSGLAGVGRARVTASADPKGTRAAASPPDGRRGGQPRPEAWLSLRASDASL
jgi:hypothetical protein